MFKSIFSFILCTMLLSATSKEAHTIHYAKVLEVTEVRGYDYLWVDENGTERWVAIAKAPVSVGDRIGYDTQTVMKNFKSKSLNRTFDEIVFANEIYLSQKIKNMKEMFMTPASKVKAPIKEADSSDFKEKTFYTVEALFRYRKNLAGKTVTVKAKVRKVSHQIMKRDWVHLEDGTGVEHEHNNDIVFTAKNTSVKAGDTVQATGTLVIDRDFGYGYFYPVLVEKARFTQIQK